MFDFLHMIANAKGFGKSVAAQAQYRVEYVLDSRYIDSNTLYIRKVAVCDSLQMI